MTAQQVIDKIEEYAPLSLQADYDNSGLMLGDRKSNVTGIFITLDIDLEAIDKAKQNNCNFILTHHPLIFHPIKSINYDDYNSKVINRAIKEDMIVYSAHTSVDNRENSIAYQNLADIGAENITHIGEIYFGEIDNISVGELAEKLIATTGDSNIKCTYRHKNVAKLAHINGSGGRMDEILPILVQQNVDVFISSEFKYSFLRDLYNNSIASIDICHYNSERAFCLIMKKLLSESFECVIINDSTQNPYIKE